jgi:hypothetical protein
MSTYVLMISFFFPKGSAESNGPNEEEAISSSHSKRRRSWFYRNSLSLAFFPVCILARCSRVEEHEYPTEWADAIVGGGGAGCQERPSPKIPPERYRMGCHVRR